MKRIKTPFTQQVPIIANGCFQTGACTYHSVGGMGNTQADEGGGNLRGKKTGRPSVHSIRTDLSNIILVLI